MTDYAAARHNMVESQLRTNRVTDPALVAAMANLPREAFLPLDRRPVAYIDEDIRLAPGRFLMEPMVLGRLLQAAEPGKDDIALIVGCGTGYETAVLARLVATAIGLESDPALVRDAGTILTELGVDNAVVVEGALAAGYSKHAPYNVVLFAGAVAEIPAAVASQLAEGGRLVAVRRKGAGLGEATLTLRRGGVLSGRSLFDAATPFLPGFAPQPAFSF